MRNLFFILTMMTGLLMTAQTSIPSVQIKTVDGKPFNTSDIVFDGPVIIDFWATWCKPCVKELNAIIEEYEALAEETGLKIYAVSIDNARTSARVAPFVNTNEWPYIVLLDANSDFKRAMNVINVPHVFIFDKNGNLVEQHTSYNEGDEEHLFELIRKLGKE
ncbi:MAG: TlpA family protein disulfide reductase [Bacteroidales bacterium]|nr:TlpA family protein disulfide reductase [Bacteroidales bacterium]